MLLKLLNKSFLVILLTASVSNAYPGDQHGIGFGDGYGQDQHAICDNPYEPCTPSNPGYPGNPGYPNHPGQPPAYGQRREVKSIWIGRSVRNETLPLRQLSGIDSRYRGWEIVSIRGGARPNSANTTVLQLIADDRVVDTQVNPGYEIDLRPQRRLIIGSTVRELQLHVQGSTQIDSIEIEIVSNNDGVQPPPYVPPHNPPHNPPPSYGVERLNLNINRVVYSNDRIDLLAYVDMWRYRGARIEQIIVEATPHGNVALADVLVNGWSAGTLQFDRYSSSKSIHLSQRPDIGGAASSLVLATRGNMTIQRVVLVVRR